MKHQAGEYAPGTGAPGMMDLQRAMALLKTPTAQLAVNGGSQHPDKRRAGGHRPTLADQVEHLLPTPRATDGTKGGPNQRGSSGDLMLPTAVMGLLPTPSARDGKGRDMPGRQGGRSLPDTLLPTPMAADGGLSRGRLGGGGSGGFGLRDVSREISSGEPTSQQSDAGKPSSDAPLPVQLSLDGLASD